MNFPKTLKIMKVKHLNIKYYLKIIKEKMMIIYLWQFYPKPRFFVNFYMVSFFLSHYRNEIRMGGENNFFGAK